jgi:hypothetical protein
VHQGTNIIKHVKAFLGQKKKKDKGKTCFHVNIWKHHDATLFGAEKAWVSPSPLHLPEVKKFLLSFKKERKHAKVMGNLDKSAIVCLGVFCHAVELQWTKCVN